MKQTRPKFANFKCVLWLKNLIVKFIKIVNGMLSVSDLKQHLDENFMFYSLVPLCKFAFINKYKKFSMRCL